MNKKRFLIFSLLFSWAFFAAGQDWQTIKSHQKDFYKCYPVQSTTNSAKNINAIRIDSAFFSGSDSVFFNFNSIRDTATFTFPGCVNDQGASWLGSRVIVNSSGLTTFFNSAGDSIFIKSLALLNEAWPMYTFANGNYLEAKITSIDSVTINGMPDSVKIISLQCKDVGGNAIYNEFNGRDLRISKRYGISKLYDFYNFPADTIAYSITAFHVMTVGELYDYNVADEFGYSGSCSGGPPYGFLLTVLEKHYSPLSDTVYYHLKRQDWHYQMNWMPSPHLDFITSTDTNIYESHTNLSDPVVSAMPSERIRDTLLNSIGSYEMVQNDSLVFAGLLTYYFPSYVDFFWDSCYVGQFEENDQTDICVAGCGCYTIKRVDNTAAPQISCSGNLNYIMKNGVVLYGHSPVFPSALSIEDLSGSNSIAVYPSPASGSLTVRVKLNDALDEEKAVIMDVEGRIVKTTEGIHPGNYEMQIDISELSNGVYFLKIKNITKRIVVIK